MRTGGEFTTDTIIWSADVSKQEIMEVIEAGALPEGTVIKLDRLFFESESKDFIDWCENKGYPVFCDAKIIEIPVKSIAIASTYLVHSPFMLNIMAGAISTMNFEQDDDRKKIDALKLFAEACNAATTRSCVVTVLTSKTELTCMHEFGMDPIKQVLRYVSLAHDAGITDIVCSPKEAAAIRTNPDFDDMMINTPGVRLPDSSKDDQARVTTPSQALKNGANRLVIGRDLIRGEGDIVERVAKNYTRILEDIGVEA